MKRPDYEGFNKEKLSFLLAAGIVSFALYSYFATAPIPLPPTDPITSISKPENAVLPRVGEPQPETFYVMDGNLTRMLDPRTGQLVNRGRKTPFAPAAHFIELAQKRPKNEGSAAPAPPPPPQQKAEPVQEKAFVDQDPELEVDFMGVVMMKDGAYGLLRPKDGSTPLRVKVGDTLKEWDYKVTKIEKQAIWVADADGRPFVLKNSRFSDAVSSVAADDMPSRNVPTTPKQEPKSSPNLKNAPNPANLINNLLQGKLPNLPNMPNLPNRTVDGKNDGAATEHKQEEKQRRRRPRTE